jgi:outer membrane receptor protein involved in Fe transport
MKYLFFFLLILFSISANSQEIRGIITDEASLPLEYVKVKLMRLDSTAVGGAFSDDKGKFVVTDVKPGSYIIQISLPPFTILNKNVDFQKETDLGVIVLKMDKTLELEGVIARGSLDVLKAGIDKKIYTTQDDLVSQGGTVQDILNNIPSIEVDQDGNISLRGDANVIILIDGRPSALAMGDGSNLLSALPANSVERIEVVTNPSAKYDPDGTSGIINIVMKKNKLKGFNGMVSATAATGNQYEGNLALSYRNQKFNLYGNYSFNHREGYRNNINDLVRSSGTVNEVTLMQRRTGDDLEEGNTGVLGFDYYFNDLKSFSLSGTVSSGIRERYGDLFTTQFDANGDTLDFWNRRSLDPERNLNFDINANYTQKFKEDKGEWSVNINRSSGKNRFEALYEQDNYWLGGTELNELTVLQRLTNFEQTSNTTLQTDLSRIFAAIKARAEFGFKSIIRDQELAPRSETFDYGSQSYEEDTLANFDYTFHFEVHSLYALFGQELGKFKYQGGLRAEYAVQAPNLISSNESYRKEYRNLFPSAHLKYEVAKNSELSLSYSRRINRPGGEQLNPFTSYADPFNLRSGNPFLDPESINSFDLGYSINRKKINFSTSTFHRRTNDVINRVKVFNPDNSSRVTYGNIDRSISTGMEFVVIWKPVKWLKTTFSANGNYIEYIEENPVNNWNNSGFNWNAKNATTIDFWKETASIQLNVAYNAPRVSPQGIVQRRGGIDLAFSKSFLNKNLMFVLRGSDLFDNIGFQLEFDRDDIFQESEFKWLTRRISLTVSYKFGKYEMKVKSPQGGGGGDE